MEGRDQLTRGEKIRQVILLLAIAGGLAYVVLDKVFS